MLTAQEDMSSCSAKRHVTLLKKIGLLAEQERMSSEDMSSSPARRQGSSKNKLFGVSCRDHLLFGLWVLSPGNVSPLAILYNLQI